MLPNILPFHFISRPNFIFLSLSFFFFFRCKLTALKECRAVGPPGTARRRIRGSSFHFGNAIHGRMKQWISRDEPTRGARVRSPQKENGRTWIKHRVHIAKGPKKKKNDIANTLCGLGESVHIAAANTDWTGDFTMTARDQPHSLSPGYHVRRVGYLVMRRQTLRAVLKISSRQVVKYKSQQQKGRRACPFYIKRQFN